MNQNEVHQLFEVAYMGEPNFMTPTIEGRGSAGNFAWELSTGRGFENEPIFGVTVLEDDNGQPIKRHDLSDCFMSRSQAMRHIESLEGD